MVFTEYSFSKATVTLSRFKPRFTTTHPDLRQMVKSGCVGMEKKRNSSINTMSHDAPTMSARFIHGSITTHDGSATIHHGGATNAHDASTIRYGASTIQAGSATLASRPPTNVHDLVVVMRQAKGEGLLSFFSICRLGPSIYRSPPPKKKISGITSTPPPQKKKILNFSK